MKTIGINKFFRGESSWVEAESKEYKLDEIVETLKDCLECGVEKVTFIVKENGDLEIFIDEKGISFYGFPEAEK